jgi:small-conductance mechanosensitive channel
MAASDEGQQKAARLINDLQDISFTKIGLILFGTWLVILLARKLLPYLAERGPSQLRLVLLGAVPIIRLVMLIIAILWVIPIVFNITLQNFLVIAGALGVAIGFAFKDYVSSLIAGIVAIVERPYRPGDWVRIGGDYGEVRSVGMRSIEICTPADDIVHVPHEKIWRNNIANSNNGARTLMCVASFYLRPDHDAARLRVALQDVAFSSAYLEYDKPVLVMLAETPLGTHYQLKAYPFDMRDQFHFVSDLTMRGKLAIAEAGAVEIQAMPGIAAGTAAGSGPAVS